MTVCFFDYFLPNKYIQLLVFEFTELCCEKERTLPFSLAKINRYELYSSLPVSSQCPCLSTILSPQWVLHGTNLFRTFEMLFLLEIRSLENTEIRQAIKANLMKLSTNETGRTTGLCGGDSRPSCLLRQPPAARSASYTAPGPMLPGFCQALLTHSVLPKQSKQYKHCLQTVKGRETVFLFKEEHLVPSPKAFQVIPNKQEQETVLIPLCINRGAIQTSGWRRHSEDPSQHRCSAVFLLQRENHIQGVGM